MRKEILNLVAIVDESAENIKWNKINVLGLSQLTQLTYDFIIIATEDKLSADLIKLKLQEKYEISSSKIRWRPPVESY